MFDIFNSTMSFGQVEGDTVMVEHGAPSGVHHIDCAIFIVGSNKQNRHRKNGSYYFNGLFHKGIMFKDYTLFYDCKDNGNPGIYHLNFSRIHLILGLNSF